MSPADFLLVDISNTYTKVAFSSRTRPGRVLRLPTRDLTAARLRQLLGDRTARHAIVASVVPARNTQIEKVLPPPVCWVGPKVKLGIGIDYPKPATIGADRLANAVAAAELYGTPAIVVDFGTAVTFDVVSPAGQYVGGVIAPGLSAMTDYLHERTALLPKVELRKPRRAIGRSTYDAMLAGAVHGYRGLIAEILRQVRSELSAKKPHIIATGGDAALIGKGIPLFDAIDPRLTLEGLRLIGCRNFPD